MTIGRQRCKSNPASALASAPSTSIFRKWIVLDAMLGEDVAQRSHPDRNRPDIVGGVVGAEIFVGERGEAAGARRAMKHRFAGLVRSGGDDDDVARPRPAQFVGAFGDRLDIQPAPAAQVEVQRDAVRDRRRRADVDIDAEGQGGEATMQQHVFEVLRKGMAHRRLHRRAVHSSWRGRRPTDSRQDNFNLERAG